MKEERKNNILDILGISTSLLCAIHCILPPVLLSFSTVSSLSFLESSLMEFIILSSAAIFAAWSLIPSIKMHHSFGPTGLALFGFLIIVGAHFIHGNSMEVFVLLSGGVLLSAAHLWNWRLKNKDNSYTSSSIF